ncbi:MAG TPA: DUF3996 domain-containing protein [Spirochaetota bacterium]|nr:DUF3996 domain-containing protein [Spirochaetota bacterium]HPJ35187.1 DUF3996 domain-containing protein [Spirochaetota bacterium]
MSILKSNSSKSVFLVLFFLISAPLTAAEGDFGAGFILGDPTGLAAKYFISGSDAFDCGIGASSHNGFYFYGDYLRHIPDLFTLDELAFYIGAGAGFQHHDDNNDKHHDRDEYNSLDIRVPVGLEYTVEKAPLGFFIEVVPALQITPDIDSDIRGGLGVRYYF